MGIPQERITQSLGISQQVISHHLQKMLMWAIFVNTELKKGFTAAQVAEKHAWPEPLVVVPSPWRAKTIWSVSGHLGVVLLSDCG